MVRMSRNATSVSGGGGFVASLAVTRARWAWYVAVASSAYNDLLCRLFHLRILPACVCTCLSVAAALANGPGLVVRAPHAQTSRHFSGHWYVVKT